MSRINNEFRLSGRIGGPVEIISPEGRGPIGKVSLAVDNGYKNRETGAYVESVFWADLTFYNAKQIERLEKYAGKGREIHVMGTITKDVWQSRTRKNEDGTAAMDSKIQLVVSSLILGREPRSVGQTNQDTSSTHDSAHDEMDDEHTT